MISIHWDRILFWAGAIGASVLVAALTLVSPQLGATAALCGLVVGIYIRHPPSALILLWSLWLLAPMLRRIFALLQGTPAADPLSLAPFIATGVIGALELLRSGQSRRVRLMIGLVGAALLIGIPAGVGSPDSLAFALASYSAALVAFLLGYREGASSLRTLSLRRALLIALPPIAVYGILQYTLPLSAWDQNWLDSVDYVSIGAPEEGKLRVWSTLNGPGTLAGVLALGVVLIIGARRVTRWEALTGVLAMFCLALTFVRSAFVALVFGLLVLIITGGPATRRRVGAFAAICVVGVAGFAGLGSTGTAFRDRVLSVGETSTDQSARARVTRLDLVPESVLRPGGAGLGSAGEASKLGGPGGLAAPDNGLLSLLYQLGPAGLLLILGVMAWLVSLGVAARRDPATGGLAAVILSAIGVFLALELFGDALYGITGAMFWFLAGTLVRLRDRSDLVPGRSAAERGNVSRSMELSASPPVALGTRTRNG